ncbi:hypothetical protein NM75_13265 [Dickeya fangzhongdai]|nr:hypothetical protein LH89_20060 [Dickeya fangzhongdai]KGT97751.1 hypothetical protein NM75_13265 [Dickeya fangzhongdai]
MTVSHQFLLMKLCFILFYPSGEKIANLLSNLEFLYSFSSLSMPALPIITPSAAMMDSLFRQEITVADTT